MSYSDELKKMFDLQKFGMKFGLDGMNNILGNLGNPHQGQSFVHLAGTNGKGSVGILLQSILTVAGYKVGLYTSPHLITFRERIRVGDKLISHDDVLRLSQKVWPACQAESPPTFFEFVTALAFLYFKEQKTDLVIVEAGLGGRLDSTNVISPIATAITNISLDHTEFLGDTIAAIAGEKAGIIKEGVPLVAGRLSPEARKVVSAKAMAHHSPSFWLGQDFQVKITSTDSLGRATFDFNQGSHNHCDLFVNLPGPHQADNAAVAMVLARHNFTVNESHLKEGLAQATWPGRIESFAPQTWPPTEPKGQATLLLDGAHNPDGSRALTRTLGTLSYDRLHLIVGVMADKDIAGVLGPVFPLAHQLYLTRPAFYRAATPGQLWDRVTESFGPPKVPVTLHLTIREALNHAAQEALPGDLVLLCGSLFTVGEALAVLTEVTEVEPN